MKSKYVIGTINKDIYIHTDAATEKRVDNLETAVIELNQDKQDKLTAGDNITITDENVISADPCMFEVTYNVTPWEDIWNAWHNGKVPVCTYNSQTFYVSMMYGQTMEYGYAIFTNSEATYSNYFSVTPTGYTPMRTVYLQELNKVTTISTNSTDDQYPSAKAVWNQAAKYTKLKRFLAHTELTQIVLDTNTAADIYNAINAQSGGQVVTVFNKDTSILYTITRAYIDENYQINISGESSHIQKDGNLFTLYHDYIVMQGIDTNQTFYNFTKQELLS